MPGGQNVQHTDSTLTSASNQRIIELLSVSLERCQTARKSVLVGSWQDTAGSCGPVPSVGSGTGHLLTAPGCSHSSASRRCMKDARLSISTSSC